MNSVIKKFLLFSMALLQNALANPSPMDVIRETQKQWELINKTAIFFGLKKEEQMTIEQEDLVCQIQKTWFTLLDRAIICAESLKLINKIDPSTDQEVRTKNLIIKSAIFIMRKSIELIKQRLTTLLRGSVENSENNYVKCSQKITPEVTTAQFTYQNNKGMIVSTQLPLPLDEQLVKRLGISFETENAFGEITSLFEVWKTCCKAIQENPESLSSTPTSLGPTPAAPLVPKFYVTSPLTSPRSLGNSV